ncbi:spore maturation protein [candidate division KSB1 bacterium]|nr:spore maturation protein [candidate division KSB1 bacterium]
MGDRVDRRHGALSGSHARGAGRRPGAGPGPGFAAPVPPALSQSPGRSPGPGRHRTEHRGQHAGVGRRRHADGAESHAGTPGIESGQRNRHGCHVRLSGPQLQFRATRPGHGDRAPGRRGLAQSLRNYHCRHHRDDLFDRCGRAGGQDFCPPAPFPPGRSPGRFRRMKDFLNAAAHWVVPLLLLGIPLYAYAVRKIRVYESFIEGAKEGFWIGVRIIPYLVGILVAIGMFRASGAMEFFVYLLTPVTDLIGMPAEVLPAALMRPLSGSGSLGIITELIKTHGAESFIGRLASTIYGCSETTFYVVAVYFGAVQIKNVRSAVWVGLTADAAGILAAVFICRYLFL